MIADAANRRIADAVAAAIAGGAGPRSALEHALRELGDVYSRARVAIVVCRVFRGRQQLAAGERAELAELEAEVAAAVRALAGPGDDDLGDAN